MKQRDVKEGHEKAIGNQLPSELKLVGKFLRHPWIAAWHLLA